MKRLFITLTIIGVVVGAHFLILKLLFKENPETKNTDSAKSESKIQRETNADEDLRDLPKPPPPSFKLDYSNCIYDKIPSVPDSDKPKSGILVDLDTGKVLWAKAPKKGVPIASMTKMMTALLAFEDIQANPEISLDTRIQVTRTASQVGGSQLYLDVRESFTLAELLKAVMVMSANDASQLVAEFLAGGNSLEFVERMNRRAKELKMPMTKFFNPHGLPGPSPAEDNVSSAEGMVILARELMKYPLAIEWASIKLDYLPRQNLQNPNESKQPSMMRNHNNLIGVVPGVNGMKTGFTRRAGFCLTATCERNGRKMAAVVTGMETKKERDTLVAKLLDWGYAQSVSLKGSDNSPPPLFTDEELQEIIPK